MQKTTFRDRLYRYNIIERFFRDPITHKRRPHTSKKVLNLFLVYLSRLFKRSHVWGYPYNILIEPTNICTLECPMCPAGNKMMTRRRGMMKFEEFKKIINEMADLLYIVGLMNYGESLLNKDIFKMIRYAKGHNISTVLSTNAQFLNRDIALALINSGLDMLSISLDGASEETYLKYRVKGDFHKTLEQIRYLVQKRNETKSDLFIDIGFLVIKYNENEIEKAKNLAQDLGVDNFSLVKLSLLNYQDMPLDEALKYLPTNPAYSRYKLINGKLRLKRKEKKKTTCIWAWDRSVINWDGSIVPCCMDFDGEYTIGNYFDHGLKKVWNGKKYAQLRKQILEDKNKIRICANCSASIDK